MTKKHKVVSRLVTEAEERKYWEAHDSTDHVDWSKAKNVRFPNLKPTTTAISLRLPLGLLEQIKVAANKRDVPYQSLIKAWLAEKVEHWVLFDWQGRLAFSPAMKATQGMATELAVGQPAPAARLTVRLGALTANYREVLRRASPAAIAPVVKADAYSLGMKAVAQRLNARGADTFFVARLEEGIALRRQLPRARIFVLDGLCAGAEPAFAAYRLTPVLNTSGEISLWSAYARMQRSVLDAAIHIDTGMNRSGLARAETNALSANARQALSGLNLALVMSHLACADEPAHPLNLEQLGRFRAALAMLPPAPASLAATAGIELGREYLFDIVRPGLGLYGGNPILARPNPYRTVVNLTAGVLQVRNVEEGESVGYGATFTARRPTVLAIAAAGYADGLMRALGARGHAMMGAARVPFAGRISMDLAALDVTDVPAEHVHAGADMEFLGDAVSLEEMAAAAGTINHEILTSLSPRAARVHVEG